MADETPTNPGENAAIPDVGMTEVNFFLLQLCAWREDEGDGYPGMLGVVFTILNRLKNPARWGGPQVIDVVCARLQFDAMVILGDPTTVKWPTTAMLSQPAERSAWLMAAKAVSDAVSGAVPDPTNGANSYVNLAVDQPKWAVPANKTAQIGRQTYFKIA